MSRWNTTPQEQVSISECCYYNHVVCRFGKGYTLQVKIRIPDGQVDDVAGDQKKLKSKSQSTLTSGSATRVPLGGDDPLGTATSNFHNFIYETFQDVTLIEEHQVGQKYDRINGLVFP